MVENIFYLVWREDTQTVSYRHPDFDSAARESRRLAEKHPGINFYVLETVGKCVKTDIIFTDMRAIPL